MTLFRAVFVVSILFLSVGDAAAFRAQIDILSRSLSNEITVTIVDQAPPHPDHGPIVGYAVVRYRHDECSVPVFISAVTSLSVGLEVSDTSPPNNCAYTYVVSLVNEAGDLVTQVGRSIGTAIKTLGGHVYPVMQGDLRDIGVFGGGGVVACADSCEIHPYLRGVAWVGGPAPDAFRDAMDTGQVFDVYGEIGYSFEGPVLVRISKAVPATCAKELGPRSVTWSTLKSSYW